MGVVKVTGVPQKTGPRTQMGNAQNAHAQATEHVAKNIPNAKDIVYNRGFHTSGTSLLNPDQIAQLKKSIPNFRPDALVQDASGKMYWVEVLSESQRQGPARARVAANADAATKALEGMGFKVTKMILVPEKAQAWVQRLWSRVPSGKVLGPAISIGAVLLETALAPPGARAAALVASGTAAGAGAVGGWGGASLGALAFWWCPPLAPVGAFVGGLVGGGAASMGARKAVGGVDLSATPGVVVGIGAPGGLDATKCALAPLTSHELAVLFQLSAGPCRGRACLSLDPVNPLDPVDARQAASFCPAFLAGTVTGQIMFEADVLVKRIMVGAETPPLPLWQPLSALGRPGADIYRVWIQPEGEAPSAAPRADVALSDTGAVQAVFVQEQGFRVRVVAQAPDPGVPTGLRDVAAAPAGNDDCFARMADQCNERMEELLGHYPVLRRLRETHRALVACRAISGLGALPDGRWCRELAKPVLEPPKIVTAAHCVQKLGSLSDQANLVTGACYLHTSGA